MSDFIQFDTSETVVGGVNVAEATKSNKKLVFNESYTIMGDVLSAPSVYACYDLTVIGNIEVDDIEVKGNLYVLNDIKAKKLSCLKTVFCNGNIDVESISANDIVANDITCRSISCPGNVLVRTTLDISESLSCDKSVIAGEGILGNGRFSSKNAVATEYFDFSGEVLGKAMELETNDVFGEAHLTLAADEPFERFFAKFQEKIKKGLQKAGSVDENKLIEFVEQLSKFDEKYLSDWKFLMENLVDLSYLDKITNFRDYLIILMAAKVMPEEIVGYETLEHVFDDLFIEAEDNIDSLPFHAKSIEDLAYALKIITLCDWEMEIEKEEALDRIFQSVGIKYKTVKEYLG